jgi:hypothetical protein
VQRGTSYARTSPQEHQRAGRGLPCATLTSQKRSAQNCRPPSNDVESQLEAQLHQRSILPRTVEPQRVQCLNQQARSQRGMPRRRRDDAIKDTRSGLVSSSALWGGGQGGEERKKGKASLGVWTAAPKARGEDLLCIVRLDDNSSSLVLDPRIEGSLCRPQ